MSRTTKAWGNPKVPTHTPTLAQQARTEHKKDAVHDAGTFLRQNPLTSVPQYTGTSNLAIAMGQQQVRLQQPSASLKALFGEIGVDLGPKKYRIPRLS